MHLSSRHTKFRLTENCHYSSAYFVGGTGTFCRRQNFSHITCDVTHSSLRDTFPSRGRPWCASKFRQPDTKLCFRRCPLSRTCHLTVTKSPLGLFKEISPKRNFFQGDPQSDCNRREGSPSLRLRRKFTHSCALRMQVGALPRHPASLREGLTQASFLGADRNSANLTQSYAFEDVRSRGHVT